LLKGDSVREKIKPSLRIGLAILVAITAVLVIAGTLIRATVAQPLAGIAAPNPLAAGSPIATRASSPFPNCRFGVGIEGSMADYNVAPLNVGWYMDWSSQADPIRPNGAEYVQMVTLQSGLDGLSFEPSTTTLLSLLSLHPGAVWLIGNEPDSSLHRQYSLLPTEYAYLYHQVYQLIKEADPSARIGIGGVVQATPLRFQYLDSILAAYQQRYGELPPADLWNIHSYILREINDDDPEATKDEAPSEPPYWVWGAFVPIGIDATHGELYSLSKMFDLNIFRQRLIDFRSWMNKWGYRDKPLYITEYGTLFPYPPYVDVKIGPWMDEYDMPLDEARTAAFMTNTFNILRTLTDAAIGYPADANRLVQRWLWYSVNDPMYGGPLFDPTSHIRRPLGDVFAAYTQAISPSVDLLAVRVLADPAAVVDTGQPQTTTLQATISNLGNIAITQPITVGLYAGWSPTGTLIGALHVFTSGLAGCAGTAEVSATWQNLVGAGAHPMYVQIDPGTLSESNPANNLAAGLFLIATNRTYLPILRKN
jgi:hypothetical protein